MIEMDFLSKGFSHPQKHLLQNESGWWDSNPRPPRPERGALAKLSHSPFINGAVRLDLHWIESNRSFYDSAPGRPAL